MRPMFDGHLYLTTNAMGMLYPSVHPTPSPSCRGRQAGRMVYITNSEPQSIAPSTISRSLSPVITEPSSLETDSSHNTGVLQPVRESHPLASVSPYPGPVSAQLKMCILFPSCPIFHMVNQSLVHHDRAPRMPYLPFERP